MSLNQVYDVSQLKHDLEAWKFLLVPINNLLEWKHNYDPFIIVAFITFVFGLIIYYSPSILTTVSIFGLVFLFFEFFVPLMTNYFFKSAEWNAASEAKYTRICERISNFHRHILNLKIKLLSTRKEKQSLYFLIVLFFLIFCAYVGQNVDNSLLTYIAIVMIALTPGARRHKIFERSVDKMRASLGLKPRKTE